VAYKRLLKNKTDSVLAGVCSGLGKYLEVDATVVRIVFSALTLFGGAGIILYLVLWLFMPNEGQEAGATQEEILKESVDDVKDKFENLARKVERTDKKYWPGIAFIILGILLLLKNAGIINALYILPTALLCLGVYLLFKE
jgi:phage shock protein C